MVEEDDSATGAQRHSSQIDKLLVHYILVELHPAVVVVELSGGHFHSIGWIADNRIKDRSVGYHGLHDVLQEDLRLAQSLVMFKVCENIELSERLA